MRLEIFDVEHGACALLTCDNGNRLMIDCGHNATTQWKPGTHLASQGVKRLAKLVISNFDEDHVSGLPDLLANNILIEWLNTNSSVTASTIAHLKHATGIGQGIATLMQIMGGFVPSVNPPPIFPGVQESYFRNAFGPGPAQFDDSNNLSLVTFLNIAGFGFLFPGDLEIPGWQMLLAYSPLLQKAVASTQVLIAAHHGRKNGLCTDIFDVWNCNPGLVVISDDYHQYDTQQTVAYYGSKVNPTIGLRNFRGQGPRSVLTTRKDGTITFDFTSGNCVVS
jgi:beta-lactamase superfamily II metal-dependent hydrolase